MDDGRDRKYVLTDISRAGLCAGQSQPGTTASPQLHHRQATSRRRTAESQRSECAGGADGRHGSFCMKLPSHFPS